MTRKLRERFWTMVMLVFMWCERASRWCEIASETVWLWAGTKAFDAAYEGHEPADPNDIEDMPF